MLLCFLIVAVFVYFFLFYPGVQVKSITISGNQKVLSSEIESLILSDVNKKILGIGNWKVTSSSIFLANSARLQKHILSAFPGVKEAKISKKFFQALNVQIGERSPVAIFCSAKEECFFIDSEGIIFEPTPEEGESMVIVRQAINEQEVFIGKQAVKSNIIDLLTRVEKSLKDGFQISLKEALVSSSARLSIKTSEGWQIYFSLNEDIAVDLQITKLTLLLSGEISAGPEENPRKNLRYIDLRLKDRAIICDNKTCGG